MRRKTANVSTTQPDVGSLELTEELIRVRAYRFFEERGCEHGHDLEDWLRAEAEVFGKKPAAAEADDMESRSKAVGIKAPLAHTQISVAHHRRERHSL
jgi:hypothetical protein